jgi:hypothetical protein
MPEFRQTVIAEEPVTNRVGFAHIDTFLTCEIITFVTLLPIGEIIMLPVVSTAFTVLVRFKHFDQSVVLEVARDFIDPVSYVDRTFLLLTVF